jgi:predicted solute-binding protein
MIRLVYSSALFCEPLLYAFSNQPMQQVIKLEKIQEMECLAKLESGEAEIALLTPLAYARSKGKILLVKDLMIHSQTAGKNILLFFKGELKNFEKVYCQELKKENSFEKFLADLVLREYFELDIDWQPLPANHLSVSLLNQLKVILLTGEPAYESLNDINTYIDLTEEWYLRTDLPFVQNVLCVHSSFRQPELLAKIQTSLQLGLANLKNIAEAYAKTHSQEYEIYYTLLTENYYYTPHPSNLESLEQLFQFMFYSGVVDYLPQIKLYSP